MRNKNNYARRIPIRNETIRKTEPEIVEKDDLRNDNPNDHNIEVFMTLVIGKAYYECLTFTFSIGHHR